MAMVQAPAASLEGTWDIYAREGAGESWHGFLCFFPGGDTHLYLSPGSGSLESDPVAAPGLSPSESRNFRCSVRGLNVSSDIEGQGRLSLVVDGDSNSASGTLGGRPVLLYRRQPYRFQDAAGYVTGTWDLYAGRSAKPSAALTVADDFTMRLEFAGAPALEAERPEVDGHIVTARLSGGGIRITFAADGTLGVAVVNARAYQVRRSCPQED